MLKITETGRNGATRTLKLEGKLLGPWLDELRSTCAQPISQAQHIRLDLSTVTFVDAEGAKLLRELTRQGIAIAACSGFVAQLLNVEKK